jgi:NCS1 family nucleobase:cation symporter-1
MIVDYFVLRRTRLDTADLYREDGVYAFSGRGFNWRAMVALLVGIAPNVPGFLAQASGGSLGTSPFFEHLYTHAWFIGFLVAGVVYYALSLMSPPQLETQLETKLDTEGSTP